MYNELCNVKVYTPCVCICCASVKVSKPFEDSITTDAVCVCVFAVLVSRAASILCHCCHNCFKLKPDIKLSAGFTNYLGLPGRSGAIIRQTVLVFFNLYNVNTNVNVFHSNVQWIKFVDDIIVFCVLIKCFVVCSSGWLLFYYSEQG